MSCDTSTMVASGTRDRMVPFISPTYPSAVPKSVRRVISGRIQRDLRFHRPTRQRQTMATALPIAVIEIVHQMPTLPQRSAAILTKGMRDAVNALEAIIGGS